jgi:hypothetical protein
MDELKAEEWADETLIDEAWLQSIGFVWQQFDKAYGAWCLQIDDDNQLEFDGDSWSLGMFRFRRPITTRGQLRRLLSVLRGAK